MIFLSVFCVVLCVRSGAFLHIQNNVPDIRYQNQEAIQLSAQRNTEIPLNNPYDDEFRRNQPIGRFSEQLKPQQNVRFELQRISPEYINSQQIKNTNEQLLNEEQGHYFQDQAHPKYINPPVRRLIESQSTPKEDVSKTTLNENIRLESQHISPKYLNFQQIKNTNEQLINQEDSINQKGQYFQHQTRPEHILLEAKRFNEAQHTPEENISGSKLQFSDLHETVRHNVLPLKHVDIGSVLTDSKNINTLPIKRLNEAKLMPMEDTTLELQAVSPEYIKSLINEDKPELKSKLSLTSPYKIVNSAKVVKYLDNKQFHSKNHFEQDEATYENPSAEVLYSTTRALPYEIEGQQLPNISEGSINFHNNANSPKRTQDIQKLMQPSKRYMIIHPDGRVEHIDEIEKITKIHPNYVMIKSQDFLKRIEGKNGISGLEISQLFANNPHDALVNQKHNQAPHHLTDIPLGHKSPPQFVKTPLYSKDTDSLGKLIVPNEPNVHQMQIKTDKVYSQMAPENNNQHDENQLLNKVNMHQSSSLVPEIENHEKNNYIKNEQSITQLTPIVKENEFKNFELTSLSPSDIQQIQTKNEQQISAYDSDSLLTSSTIATIAEKNNDTFNETVITKVNQTENTTSPFVNLTLKDNLPTSPHEPQIILNEESEQYNLNTLLVPKTSMSTPPIITENSIKDMNKIVPYQNSSGSLQNNTVTMLNATVPNTTQEFYTNHETLQNINHELSDTLSTTTRSEIGEISINTTATSVSIPNKTSFSSDEQEDTNKNVTNIMQTLNVTSPSTTPLSNAENTTNNTGFWFKADEQFWHNIMSNNDTQNLFYFFFVPPKSNIMQKETKTTLYPNGTTVEEVIETIDEDGVPRVIGTTKVFLNSTSPEA